MKIIYRLRAVRNDIPAYLYKHFNAHTINYDFGSKDNDHLISGIKRITLFVHYNVEDHISHSDWLYLLSLDEVSDIVIISNSPICDNDKKKIQDHNWTVVERENTGYDFGAWKYAVSEYRDRIKEYDEIVLVNNSCFFPAYPISRVFNEMDSRKVDFWGITAFRENPRLHAIESKVLELTDIPTHVQSYFMAFKLRQVEDCFFDFWEEFEEQESFAYTVKYGEIALTEFLVRHGKTYSVLARETLDQYKYYRSPDLSKNQPERLLYYGSPLIKKKCFPQITIKQYYIMLDYLKRINKELYEELRSITYSKMISKAFKLFNFLVRKVGCLKEYNVYDE